MTNASALPADAPSSHVMTRRPGRRRRRRGLPYPLKIATVALGGALVAYLAFLLLAKTLHPYLLGYAQSAKIARMQAHLDRQLSINASLQKRIDYLASDEGRESQARRQGFHRPGETVYLLKPEDTNPTAADKVATP